MQRAVASVFCQCGSSSSSSSTTSLARVAARTFHSKPPPTSSSRLAPYSWASPRSSTSLPPPQQTHPFSTSSRIRQQVDATTTTSTTTTTTTAASTSPSLKTSSSESSSAPYRSSSNPRFSNSRHQNEYYAKRNRSLLLYTSAVLVLGVGVTYAAVPLYRAFCQATGYGGTPMVIERPGHASGNERFAAAKLIPFLGDETRKERRIKVTFNADCSDALPWKFTPLQKEVRVRPGESALAFYTAKNNSKKDIIGIATYNVTPNNVAPYFAKVECFCFEEQKLLAGEEVDLPILFFIDRDFVDDPSMRDVDDVVLSYTFFRAKRDNYGNLVPDPSTD